MSAESDLRRRIAELERELAEATDTIRRLTEQGHATAAELAEARRQVAFIRRYRAIHLGVEGARRARRVARRAVRAARSAPALPRRVRGRIARELDAWRRARSMRASPAAERVLIAAVRAAAPPSPPVEGPLVSVLVRGGRADGRDPLAGTAYRTVERVASPVGVSGELLLLVDSTVAPITPDWLGHLVETVGADGVAAAAPRVIRARATGRRKPEQAHPDLTLRSRGITFALQDGVAVPRPLGAGEDPLGPAATAIRDVPALGGAALLVRRDAFEAAGGLDELGDPELEAVDLALRLRDAGHRLVHDGRAAVWQREDGPSGQARAGQASAAAAAPHRAFVDRWGVRLTREVLLDALRGTGRWTDRPLHVGITVTRDDPGAGYGDWHTGHELGDALEAIGFRVSYLERHQERWYRPDPALDAVIVLLDRFDIRRLPRRLVTVAWMRNWGDTWVGHPWFDDYDIVFASSEALRTLVRERTAKVPLPMAIATNPTRFRPVEAVPSRTCDVLFVGNHWGESRGVAEALPALAAQGLVVHVYGRNWESVPGIAPLHRGYLDYDEVPAAYASARVVVDDTASPTRPYGAVNSRVFDALAAGALVVTDNEIGARELFGEDLPVWSDTESLVRAVREALDRPDALRARMERARATVLAAHTYDRRATAVRDALAHWAEATRVGVRIGPPSWEIAQAWGDLHFARAIQRQLERRGHPARLDLLPDWASDPAARHDVTVHLFGLRVPRNRPGQVNVLWQISHPDLATGELYDTYDLAFAASDRFARRMAGLSRRPVAALHQATDPERFRPAPTGPAHEVLFVGNTRGVRRQILDDLGATGHDLAVYGKGWSPELVDPSRVRGESIPNADLHRYYASAALVLNDHWPDMRAEGFLSNRLYDVLASGGFVISDDVDGIDEEFDGAVPTYRRPEELRELVDRFLDDPEERRRRSAIGRRAVLERHTFERRVATILDAVGPLLAARPGRLP